MKIWKWFVLPIILAVIGVSGAYVLNEEELTPLEFIENKILMQDVYSGGVMGDEPEPVVMGDNLSMSYTPSSYTIDNEDGSYTSVNTLGYSYYPTEIGWEKINTTIVPQSIIISGNEYTLGVTKGYYNVFFRDKSSQVYGRPVAMVKDNYVITYSPSDYLMFDDGTQISGKKLTSAITSDNNLCYYGQYGEGIDLCYEYTPEIVKELLIINDKSLLPVPTEGSNLELKHIARVYNYDTDVGMDVVYGEDRIKFNDNDELNTAEEVYFIDENNNTIFYLPEIYAWETEHIETVNSSDYTDEEIIEMGYDPQFVEPNTLYDIPIQSRIKLNRTIKDNLFGNLDIRIIVPYDWLKDLEYPVYIDDTTTYEINETNVNTAWHFDGDGASVNPMSPSSAPYEEHDSAQYSNIEVDDENKNEWGVQSWFINLWYNFTISEDIGDITSIQVLWNGYESGAGAGGDDFRFNIWNYTSSGWFIINATEGGESSDSNYGTTFDSSYDFNDFISDGYLHLGIGGGNLPSCPYIYVWNGTDYYFDSEAITRHILPEWTGSQLSRLPSLEPICIENTCTYKIKITEELPENSYIDSAELIKVYHNNDKNEVYSGLGTNLWTIEDKIEPISAIDDTGKNVLDLIKDNDDVYWNDGDYSGTNYEDLDGDNIADSTNPDDLYKYLELTFDKPKNAEFVKLNYKALEFEQETVIWRNMLGIMDEKNITSELAVDGTIANWFGVNGPAMFWIQIWNGTDWNTPTIVLEFPVHKGAEVAYKFDISNVQTNDLKIRFMGIPNEGGLDYVYADYSKDKKLKTEIIPLTKATFEEKDIMDIVGDTDNNFQRLRPVGTDEILFEFEDSELEEDVTYFLNVTGYYKALPLNIMDISDEDFWRILTEPLFVARSLVYKFKEGLIHNTLYEDYVKVVVISGAEPEDTCTYVDGDWIIECSDNCDITEPVDMGDNVFIITGSGTFAVNADITNIKQKIIGNKSIPVCQVIINTGHRFG